MKRLLPICAWVFLFIWSNRAHGGSASFIVHGSVLHEQFGLHPRQETYRFTARSQGCSWSVSAVQDPKKMIDEIFAVGNDQGVFITWDLTTGFQNAQKNSKTQAINNSQAIAMTNSVPNCTLADFLGPVWLTYLSGCCLRDADPNKMPVPVSVNVAGGSSLPPFSIYLERSFWRTDDITGLPNEFVAIDGDGFLKGISGNNLVNLERYPAPFDKGFTNVVFHVVKSQKFSDYHLPQKSVLEIFWVNHSNLERIHRFTTEANQFEEVPATPLPLNSTKGIAAVVDGRLATSNGPIILQYIATNRFLTPEELTNLDGFKDAVNISLNQKPFQLISSANLTKARWIFLAIFTVVTISFLALLWKSQKQRQK